MEHAQARDSAADGEVASLRARVTELESMLAQRQQTEVASRERERADARLWLLSSLFQQTSEGLAVVNLGGNVIFVNDAFARMHGYAPEALIGKHLSIFHTPEQMASVEAANQALRKWGTFDGEVWHARRDGTVFPTLMHNTLFRDASGQIVGMIGTVQDITAAKEAERALRESEERFRIITENSLLGVYIYQDGRMLYVNSAFSRILGYKPNEIVEMPNPLALVHPEDRALAAEQIRRRLDGETETVRYRFRGIRKDGTLVQCEAFGRFIRYEGRPSIIGVLADITDRANAEAQRERLVQAVENSGEGIAIWDGRWRLTYGNAALARTLGSAGPMSASGDLWQPWLDGGDAALHGRIVESLEREGTWSGRFSGKRSGGGRVPLAVTLTRFVTTTGDPMIVGSIRDMSTEEHHLAQIRRLTADAEKSLEAEKARISRELHDELGQLLTALNLDLAWVGRRLEKADVSLQDRVAQMNEITHAVTERVRHLSKSLHPPALGHEGLAATLRSQAAEFERRTGVACRVAVEPAELNVAEPLATTVFRIVQEALTNVTKHARASRCDVSLELRQGVLEVTIRDNGVGTTPARLAGKNSLGVLAMRERADGAGGTLNIECKPGGGVSVTARLPSRRPRKPRRL